jgi:hypothetical protein
VTQTVLCTFLVQRGCQVPQVWGHLQQAAACTQGPSKLSPGARWLALGQPGIQFNRVRQPMVTRGAPTYRALQPCRRCLEHCPRLRQTLQAHTAVVHAA